MSKQKKRRLADYSTSEMVKLCGMKASSTFENKRDKVFERYEIDPTLFKMDSGIEGGENFYPVVCAELLAILKIGIKILQVEKMLTEIMLQ